MIDGGIFMWPIFFLGVLAFGYVSPADKPSLSAFRQAFQSDAGRDALKRNVTVLHCVTEYPAPIEQANVRAMVAIRERFGLPVGYFIGAQGALLVYLLLIGFYAHWMNGLDRRFGVDEQ